MTGVLLLSSTSRGADERDLVRANSLFQKLTGSRLSVRDPLLVRMADLITAGKAEEAAALATAKPGFVNNVVLQMASEMSDFENSRRSSRRLYESAARIVVVVRDDQDLKNILIDQKNFPNVIDPLCVNDREPFSCATRRNLDLSSPAVLGMRQSRQAGGIESLTERVPAPTPENPNNSEPRIYDAELPNGNMDTAGIFTDRGFGYVAYQAGTNRRGWQKFVMSYFGLSLHDLRSQNPSDRYVRGDVSRNPEGTGSDLYIRDCKTCHSTIDGITQVFAHLDSKGGDDALLLYNPVAPVAKYRRNINVYGQGYKVTTNSWEVLYTPTQLKSLGWPAVTQGSGVHSFAVALSQTKQFYRGMVKAVISYVCPNLDSTDPKTAVLSSEIVEKIATQLQVHQKLKKTFETVAARPECLGPK